MQQRDKGFQEVRVPDAKGWDGGEKLEEFQRVYIPSELKMVCEMAGLAMLKYLAVNQENSK